MSQTARAIVVGHASFAAGMVSAVDQITGRGELLLPLSNTGLSAEEIERQLREAMASGIDILFTDLMGGSATLAARRIARDMPTTIVTGTSLPVLIDFVMGAERPSPDAARSAVERGLACLLVAGR